MPSCIEKLTTLTGYRTPEQRMENDQAMRQMAIEIVSTDATSICIMTDCMVSAKNTLLYAT